MDSRFLTNYTETTFLSTIQTNLRKCKSFVFSVSFIKKAGLVLLSKDIKAAVERGVKGRIITSTYQNFTDIESLNSFLRLASEFPNFECHLDDGCFMNKKDYTTNGFHSKGYIFDMGDSIEMIIGSSNITRYALLKNVEWDLVVNCDRHSLAYIQAMTEFAYLWDKTYTLSQERINEYSTKLNFAIERWDMDYDMADSEIKPNYMQRKALRELNRNRAMGVERSLVISATGSGKTYLAAFDALNFNPDRLLYIVHEGTILGKSLETFQRVFGGSKTCGMYSGEAKELDADFIFSTNVSMCRSIELGLFDKKEFDYIIIDECHHAVADSYRRIIDYFQPEFLLGLTATENRMDNKDVVELFGNNVPYELRLRDAIINDLIVPFHYYGIRDELVDYGLTTSGERKLIAQISQPENCEFIRQQIEKHRHKGQKLKALAFCRNIQHARMMADNLSDYYHTAFLSGKNSTGERFRAYKDLQNDEKELQILFAVDILNEGVDIPGVNMVLFLRPTESSTIFLQQLGRGLRKYKDKKYVTILDFIGNSYKRSVHIALALGSLSRNSVLEKKLLKLMVRHDFKTLGLEDYGVQIHIDDLSKEEIIDKIESENFNRVNYLKTDYQNFKSYLKTPTYPTHMDYMNNDYAPNLLKFMKIKIAGKKTNSYYGFLKGVEETTLPVFTDSQVACIDYLSSMLPLVRKHEFLIAKYLIDGMLSVEELNDKLQENIDGYQQEQMSHAVRFMQEGGAVSLEGYYIKLRGEQEQEYKDYLTDLLDYGITQYAAQYENDKINFLLWQDYRMDQVLLKILDNPKHNQLGTYYKNGNMYVFAGLKKDASVQEHLNYKDKFLDKDVFQWESVANISSKEQELQQKAKCVFLFVRKVKEENGITLPYTYIGTGHLKNPRYNETDNGSILYDIHMDNPLSDDLVEDFKWTE